MRTKLMVVFAILLLALFVSLFQINCTDSDGGSDSDDDANDSNGWNSDGCSWEMSADSGSTSKLTSAHPMNQGVQPCIPELPDDDGFDFEAQLTKILEELMGAYETETGGEVVLHCRPEGRWLLPDSSGETFCDTGFMIPVLIEFPDDAVDWPGRIEHYGSYVRLFYSDADESWEFEKVPTDQPNLDYPGYEPDNDYGDKIVWESTYPDESRVWIKIDQ